MSQISIFLADLDVIFFGYPEIRKFELSLEFLRKKFMLFPVLRPSRFFENHRSSGFFSGYPGIGNFLLSRFLRVSGFESPGFRFFIPGIRDFYLRDRDFFVGWDIPRHLCFLKVFKFLYLDEERHFHLKQSDRKFLYFHD